MSKKRHCAQLWYCIIVIIYKKNIYISFYYNIFICVIQLYVLVIYYIFEKYDTHKQTIFPQSRLHNLIFVYDLYLNVRNCLLYLINLSFPWQPCCNYNRARTSKLDRVLGSHPIWEACCALLEAVEGLTLLWKQLCPNIFPIDYNYHPILFLCKKNFFFLSTAAL